MQATEPPSRTLSRHDALALFLLGLGGLTTLLACAFCPPWVAIAAFTCTGTAIWAVHDHRRVVGEIEGSDIQVGDIELG